MSDDCPKCGYPSKGGFKGIYTPGEKCDGEGCGFVETDWEILAIHMRRKLAIEARADADRAMLVAVRRTHAPAAPASFTETLMQAMRERAPEAGSVATLAQTALMRDLLGYGAKGSGDMVDIARKLLEGSSSDPEATRLLSEVAKWTPEERALRKPEMVAACGEYLLRRANPYAKIVLHLAEALKLQRDRSVAAATKGPETQPEILRRALAEGLIAIGITDLRDMTAAQRGRIRYCLLMVEPNDTTTAPLAFEQDRIPQPSSMDATDSTHAWLDRRRFLLAAACVLGQSKPLESGPLTTTTIDSPAYVKDLEDVAIFNICRHVNVDYVASRDLDAMGVMMRLTQPRAPAWLKEGAWVQGPVRVRSRQIGGGGEEINGRANFVVEEIVNGMVRLVASLVSLTRCLPIRNIAAPASETFTQEERIERWHTVGEVVAHFPQSDRKVFPLGLPCERCGMPSALREPPTSQTETACEGCAKHEHDVLIARLDQQIRFANTIS